MINSLCFSKLCTQNLYHKTRPATAAALLSLVVVFLRDLPSWISLKKPAGRPPPEGRAGALPGGGGGGGAPPIGGGGGGGAPVDGIGGGGGGGGAEGPLLPGMGGGGGGALGASLPGIEPQSSVSARRRETGAEGGLASWFCVILWKGLKLSLEFKLTLAGSLNLGLSSSKLGLLVLSLSHGGLLSLLLFLLTELALLHLFLKSLEPGFRSLSLLGKVILLFLCIIPMNSLVPWLYTFDVELTPSVASRAVVAHAREASSRSLVLSTNTGTAAFTLEIKDEIADLILYSKRILPAALLMLTGVVTTTLLETILNASGKVSDTFLNIADHAFVALLLVLDLDVLLFKSLGCIDILSANIDFLALPPGPVPTIGAPLPGKLGNFIREVLELSLEGSSLSFRIPACQGRVRVRINILLDATNAAVKLVGLTSITSIENVVFFKVLLVSKIHSIQKNLLLLNLLLELVNSQLIVRSNRGGRFRSRRVVANPTTSARSVTKLLVFVLEDCGILSTSDGSSRGAPE
ncbi:hypothetical protein HG531_011765 [Fusarium graminearum]|nr:hypothetical protein HG531_011765 [Fusarium graminearum]